MFMPDTRAGRVTPFCTLSASAKGRSCKRIESGSTLIVAVLPRVKCTTMKRQESIWRQTSLQGLRCLSAELAPLLPADGLQLDLSTLPPVNPKRATEWLTA